MQNPQSQVEQASGQVYALHAPERRFWNALEIPKHLVSPRVDLVALCVSLQVDISISKLRAINGQRKHKQPSRSQHNEVLRTGLTLLTRKWTGNTLLQYLAFPLDRTTWKSTTGKCFFRDIQGEFDLDEQLNVCHLFDHLYMPPFSLSNSGISWPGDRRPGM